MTYVKILTAALSLILLSVGGVLMVASRREERSDR